MTQSGSKFGVRLAGDQHITWFADRATAEREEWERLYGAKIRAARQAGKTVILTADVARQAEAMEQSQWKVQAGAGYAVYAGKSPLPVTDAGPELTRRLQSAATPCDRGWAW